MKRVEQPKIWPSIPQLNAAPQDGSASVDAALHSVEYSYSGPLPHPDILRHFDEIVPGSAQRIIVQFEEQSTHRRSLEAKVIASNSFSQRLGSASASAIGLLATSGGLWLVHEGKSVAGLATFIVAVGALTGTYFYSKRSQSRQREEKQRRD